MKLEVEMFKSQANWTLWPEKGLFAYYKTRLI